MDTKERMLSLLPYYMRKNNIIKYYNVMAKHYDNVTSMLLDIIDSRSLYTDSVAGLEVIADIIGLQERSSDINTLKQQITNKIIQNNSRGYIEDINTIAELFLGDKFLGVQEGWSDITLKEPAMLELKLDAEKFQTQTTLKRGTRVSETGTLESNTKLEMGAALQGTSKYNVNVKTDSVVIPDLKGAMPIGVRLQIQMYFYKTFVNIITNPITKFKNIENRIKGYNANVTKYKSNDFHVTNTMNNKDVFKNTQNKINAMVDDIKIQKNALIQCGMVSCGAELGVLL